MAYWVFDFPDSKIRECLAMCPHTSGTLEKISKDKINEIRKEYFVISLMWYFSLFFCIFVRVNLICAYSVLLVALKYSSRLHLFS